MTAAQSRADLRAGVTIALAVTLAGASFGALAGAAGLPPLLTVAMSALVYAGGAQLLVLGVLTGGGSAVAAVVAGLLVNLRNLPYGLALGPYLPRGALRWIAPYGVVDAAVPLVLARADQPDRARWAFWTATVLQYVGWQLGTIGGVLLGAAVPDPQTFGVDAALPAALLGLLAPLLRRPDARRVGAGAAVVALGTTPLLPAGLAVLAGLAGLGAAGRSTQRPPRGRPAADRPEGDGPRRDDRAADRPDPEGDR